MSVSGRILSVAQVLICEWKTVGIEHSPCKGLDPLGPIYLYGIFCHLVWYLLESLYNSFNVFSQPSGAAQVHTRTDSTYCDVLLTLRYKMEYQDYYVRAKLGLIHQATLKKTYRLIIYLIIIQIIHLLILITKYQGNRRTKTERWDAGLHLRPIITWPYA